METKRIDVHHHEELLCKILNRTAKVGIIGLGYVGLPLAVEAASAGYDVIGVENNVNRCQSINEGQNYIKDVADLKLKELVSAGKIAASVDFSPLKKADVIIICVPTPLNKNKEPDISYIKNSINGICQNIHRGILIILESTTYPGTTEEIIQTQIERIGYLLGKDFFLGFSPERIDPGNPKFNTSNTTKIVGGVTAHCLKLAETFYRAFIQKVIKVSSPRVAEMTKVFENIYRSVNIALVNELAMLCERMDIDVFEVIHAAGTKPYGFQAFWPGPGVGGHCIPLDPYYLAWKSKEFDLHARFIELAGEINENMPRVVLSKVSDLLNANNMAVKGAKILQLGVSYKKDIDDARESPAVKVYELLIQKGADITVVDPYVKEFWTHENDFTYGNCGPSVMTTELTDQLIKASDLVLLLTDHSDYPYKQIAKMANIIFDTRNAFGFRNINAEHIYHLSKPVKQKSIELINKKVNLC